MYSGLQHAHSGLRWLLLAFLLIAIFNALIKRQSGVYGKQDQRFALFALIFTHLQLILGLVLYFISPKVVFEAGVMSDKILRFFTVEHITLMLIAIALITVGYSKAKRAATDRQKFSRILWFYLAGLILILAAIPWPFRGYGAGWF